MSGIAFIFDMDGVVVDSIPYHRACWEEYITKNGLRFSKKFFDTKINARRGLEIMRTLFGDAPSNRELLARDEEREALWRKRYGPHCVPLPGLVAFLKAARAQKIKMALATSAPPKNVALVLAKTKLRKYFDHILDARGVKNGKPAPDIFLKAAKKLGTPARHCIVFEDAPNGVAAARAAGTKLVAVTTTNTKKQLAPANCFIANFENFTVAQALSIR